MLLEMIDALRKWEAHVLRCGQCKQFDDAEGPAAVMKDNRLQPCGIGRAFILNLLHILEKGL